MQFFERPILNSPYAIPRAHWELDGDGRPTDTIIDRRRRAELVSPIPAPKRRGGRGRQTEMVLDTGHGLSTESQEYNPSPVINELRQEIERWRALPRSRPSSWCNFPGGLRA